MQGDLAGAFTKPNWLERNSHDPQAQGPMCFIVNLSRR